MPKEWTPAICPECTAGKCGNCDGTALDEHTDLIVECACEHGGAEWGTYDDGP